VNPASIPPVGVIVIGEVEPGSLRPASTVPDVGMTPGPWLPAVIGDKATSPPSLYTQPADAPVNLGTSTSATFAYNTVPRMAHLGPTTQAGWLQNTGHSGPWR